MKQLLFLRNVVHHPILLSNKALQHFSGTALRSLGIVFLLLWATTTQHLQAQNSLNSGDFVGGSWGAGQSMSASAGGSLIITKTVATSGDKYFRFYGDGSPCGEYQPTTNGDFFTHNVAVTAPNGNCGSANAWRVNMPTASSTAVFKTDGGNDGIDRSIVYVIQGAVQSVSSVAQSPVAASVFPGQAVTVTATLSGAFATGQAAYLRYSTDNFATSTVVAMTGGSPLATIPATANTPGAVVRYYVFTSGNVAPASNGSDADFSTINLNNNGGSNYSYTVASGWTTAATGNWTAAATWTANAVPPTAQTLGTVTINHSIIQDANALASSVVIGAGGTLTATANTLTVSNNTSGTTFTNSGSMALSSTHTVAFSGTATHTISGTTSFNNVSTATGVNFGASSTVNGSFTINAGGFVSTNAPTYGGSSTLVYNTGAAYGASTEWTSNALTGQGVPFNVSLTTASTSVNFGASTQYRRLRGSLSIAASTTLALSTASGGDLRIGGNWTNSGTFTASSRAVFFDGSAAQSILTGGTSFAFLFISNTAADVTASTAVTVTSSLTIDANARLNMQANLLTLTGSTSTVNGFLRYGNTVVIAGATTTSLTFSSTGTYEHNVNGGTIPTATWSGGSPGSTCAVIGWGLSTTVPPGLAQSFFNFTWNSTGQSSTLNMGGNPTTINGNFSVLSTGTGILRWGTQVTASVAGNLIITSNGTNSTLQTNNSGTASTISIGGNLIITQTTNTATLAHNGSSTTTITFNKASGSQTFSSSGTISGPISWNVGTGSSTNTVQLLSNINLGTGTGTFTSANNATTDFQNFVLSGSGTFVAATGSALISANTAGFNTSGASGSVQTTTRTFTNAGVNYTFNAGSAQNTGTAVGAASNIRNLVINNSAGVTLGASATLSATGTLTFTNGLLDLSTLNLTMTSGAATSGVTSARYVRTSSTGRMLQTVGGTAVAFPVGNSAYNPITLTNSGTSDVLGIRVVDGSVANANDATKAVNRAWVITEAVAGGSTLSVVAQYNTGEEGTNFNAGSSPKIGFWKGSSPWTEVSATLAGSNPFTATSGATISPADMTTSTQYFAVGKDDALAAPVTTYTWTGSTDTDWATSTNWSPNGVPGTFDNVIISSPGTNTLSINSSRTVNDFTVSGTGTFTTTSAGSLTITGAVTSTTSASVTLDCASTVSISNTTAQTIPAWNFGNLNATGGNRSWVNGSTTRICGNFVPGAGTYTVTGSTVEFNGTAAQAINTNAANFATLNITNTAALVTANAGVTASTAMTVNASAVYRQASGTLTISGATVNINGTLRNSTATDIVQTGATVTVGATGTYDHNRNGGALLTATWSVGSTCMTSGSGNTVPTGLGQSFSDFTWGQVNTTNINLNSALTSVGRDLRFTYCVDPTIISLSTTAALTLNVGRDLIVTDGRLVICNGANTNATTVNVGRDLVVSGGTTGGSVIVAGSSASNTGLATLAVTGAISLTSTSIYGALVGTYFTKTASITCGGGYTQNNSTGFAALSSTSAGNCTMTISSGDFTLTSGTFAMTYSGSSGTCVLNVNGPSNTMNVNGGTLYLIGSSSGPGTRPIINVAGNFSQTNGNIDFAPTYAGGANPAGEIAVSKNFTRSGTGYIRSTSSINNGRITFAGVAQTYTSTTSGNFTRTDITINSGSNLTLANDVVFDNTATPAQTLTVSSGGTLTCGTNLVTNPGGTGTSAAVVVSSGGNVFTANTAGLTTSGATGSLQTGVRTYSSLANYGFNGGAGQVTGNFSTATTPTVNAVADLTVNNGSDLTLSSTLSVNDTLKFVAGDFIIGSNDLSAVAISGFGASKYVKTNSTGLLKQCLGTPCPTTAVVFPVGNSAYNPLALSHSSTSDTYGVRVIDGAVANANDATKAVDRSWVVTETIAGGSSLSVVAQYNSGEEGANFNAGTTPYVGFYKGSSPWVQQSATAAGSNPYTYTAGGTFSPTNLTTGTQYFAIGKDDAFIAPVITYSWNGSTDSDWATTTNWTPNGTPGAADNVVIDSTGTFMLSINSARSVNNFTLSGTGNFTSTSAGSLTVNGNITSTSSATPSLDCASTVFIASTLSQTIPAWNFGNLDGTGGARTLASSGTIGICGTFTPGAGAYTITGSTVSFNGTGAQSVNAINYNNLTISGARTTNNVTLTSGTIGVAGAFSATATFSSGAYVNTGNTVNFNGTSTQTVGAFAFYNNLTISGARGGATVTLASGTIGVAGTFNPSATAVTYSSTGNTFDYTSAGAQTIVGFDKYNNLSNSGNGNRTLSSTTTIKIDGTYTPTTGTVTIGTSTIDFTNTSLVSNQPIPATFYYNLTNSGNGNRIWANSGIIDVNNSFGPGTGTHTITGSTFRYSSQQNVVYNMTSFTTNVAGRSYNNLILAGNNGFPTTFDPGGSAIGVAGDLTITSGTLRMSSATFGAGTVSVDGTLLVNGGTLNTCGTVGSNGTVNLYGNLSMTSGTITKTSSAVGAINFYKSSGAQSISIAGGTISNSTAWNIGDGITTNTVNFSTSVASSTGVWTVANNATVSFGTSVLTGTGSFIMTAGGTLATGNTGGIASSGATGSVQTTTRTFVTTANYTYNSSLATQVTGTGLPATVNNLTIDNTSALDPGVNLTASVTVAGVLNMSNGILRLGVNNVIVSNTASGAVTGGGSGAFVQTNSTGELRRAIAGAIGSATTYAFPVGTSTNYTPASYSFSATGNAFTLHARAIAGTHPSMNSTGTQVHYFANRYWVTNTSGTPNTYTYQAQYTYITGDQQGTVGNIRLNKWSGVWAQDNSSSATSTVLSSGTLNETSMPLAATAEWTGRDNPPVITYTWTGTASSAWTNPNNWSPNTSVAGPTFIDNIIISSVGTNMLNITGSRTITDFTLSGTGDFDITATDSLTITGTTTSTSSTAPTLDCGSMVLFNSTSSQTIPAWNFGNLDASGGARVLASSGTIGICGNYTPSAGLTTTTGSAVNFNGTAGQSILTNAATFRNLTVSNTAANVTAAAAITVTNLLTISNSARLDMGTNALTVTGATSAISGFLRSAVASTTPIIGASTATLTFNSGGTYECNAPMSGVALSGLGIPLATWNNGSVCAIIGLTNPTTGGWFGAGAGVTFSNFIWNCASQSTAPNMAGATITTSRTFTMLSTGSSELRLGTGTNGTINCGAFNQSGGTINMSAGAGIGTISVNFNPGATGAFTQTGGTITESGTGSGLISFSSAVSQTVTISNPANITNLINFRLNNSAGAVLAAGTILPINSDATLFRTAGAFSGAGSISYNATNSRLEYSGVTAMTVSTYEWPLTNGPATQVAISGGANITLDASRTLSNVTNYLYLSNGLLLLGNNNLTASAATNIGALSGFAATRMIVTNGTGELRYTISTTTPTTYVYPIGENTGTTEYSPVSITFNANSVSRTLGFRVTDAAHPQNNSPFAQTNFLSRYWSSSNSAAGTYNYQGAFTYTAADINGTEALIKVNMYNGTNWIETTSTAAANTLTISAAVNETNLPFGATAEFTGRVGPPLYYRTASSGNWGTAATWLVSYDAAFVAPAGVAATSAPTATNSIGITIMAGHSITSAASVSADQLTIQSTGSLEMTNNALTIADGAGTDVTINSGATLLLSGTATITINSGATIQVDGLYKVSSTAAPVVTNSGTTTVTSTGTYEHARNAGIIPNCTWNTGSTCLITGTGNNAPTGLNQSFHHFTVNTTLTNSVNCSGALQTINGKFKITTNHASNAFALGGDTPFTLTVADSTIITNGILNITNGTGVMTLNANGPLVINGSGSALTKRNATATTINFNNNFIQNAGLFDFNEAGSTSSTVNFYGDVVMNGTVGKSGGGTPTANFIKSGGGTQTWTFGGTNAAGLVAWNIGNGATTNTVQLLSNVPLSTSAHTFAVQNGATFNMGPYILSGTNTAFTLNATGAIKLGHAAGIVTAPTLDGNVRTLTRTFPGTASYFYNGTANQATGNALPGTLTGTGNLNIEASSGVVVTLTNNNTTTPTFNLISGLFAAGNTQQLNITSGGTVNATGGDWVTGNTAGLLNFPGSGTFTGSSNPYNVYTSGGVNFGTGTVTIQNGGTFRINGGGFVNTNAPFYAAGSTLQYWVNTTYGRGFEWSAASGRGFPHHVSLGNNSLLIAAATGAVNANVPFRTGGNVSIDLNSAIYMDFGGNNMIEDLRVGGNLSITGALSGSTTSGSDIYVAGDWVNNGTSTNFFPNGRAVFLNGTGTQNISGTNTSFPTFPFLFIDKTSGTVTLSRDIQVTTTLEFTSANTANINASSFTVYVSGTSTGAINRVGSGHVIGNLRREMATGSNTYNFTIGDAGVYSPVSIAANSVTVGGSMTASTTTADHPQIASSGLDNTKSVNRYWTLSQTGLTLTNFDPTFTFTAGDVDGGVNTSNLLVGRHNSGWTYPAIGTRTATTTQATGLNAYGDFALAECKQPSAFTVTGGGSYCSGGSGMPVGLSGSEAFVSYQLQRNNVNIGSPVIGTGSAISFGNQTADSTYTVIATNLAGGGCSASMTGSVVITIIPTVTPSVTIAANPGGSICAGTSVTFSATGQFGGPTPTYQWQLNGGNVGTNSTTYINAALANGDVVRCIMTSSETCPAPAADTSNVITMTVLAFQTPTISITASPSNNICSGDVVTFAATTTFGGGSPIYQWRLNGSNFGTNNDTLVYGAFANGDQVDCILTSDYQCLLAPTASSNVVTMNVTAAPQVNAGSAMTTCGLTPYTFANGASNSNTTGIVWTENGAGSITAGAASLTPTYTPAAGDLGNVVTFTLTGTGNAPCGVVIDQVTLTVTPLLNWYVDADGDGFGAPGIPVVACTNPGGRVTNNQDCCDTNADVNPLTEWWADLDGDGYGSFIFDNGCFTGVSCSNATWLGLIPYYPGAHSNIPYALDCNDNSVSVNPGMNEVCGNNTDDDCNGTIDIGCTSPQNDAFANASSVTVNNPNAYYPNCQIFNGSVTNAGISAQGNPANVSVGAGRDVWYRFVAPSTGVRITVQPSGFDAVIELRTAAHPVGQVDVENVNNNIGGLEILNTVSLTAGTTYYVGVRNYNATNTGTFTICISPLLQSGCGLPVPVGGFSTCANYKAIYRGAATYTFNFTGTGGAAAFPFVTTVGTTTGLIPLSTPALDIRYGGIYSCRVDANYALVNGLGAAEPLTMIGTTASANCTNIQIINQPNVEVRSSQRCPATLTRSTFLMGTAVAGNTIICAATGYRYRFTKVTDCTGTTTAGLPFTQDTPGNTPFLNLAIVFPSALPNLGYWRVEIAPIFSYGLGNYGPARVIQVTGTSASMMLPELNEGMDAAKSDTEEPQLGIYPNPNNGDMVNVNLTDLTEDRLDIVIYDAMGKMVHQYQFAVEQSLNTILVFNEKLVSGVYTMEFRCGDRFVTRRMVVQN